MNFISIDIETLGLSIDAPVIEVGAVMVIDNEIQDSRFHCYVGQTYYNYCEPYAMSMHPHILKRIATEGGVTPGNVWYRFKKWVADFNLKGKWVMAGKNVAGFDLPRLERHCEFDKDYYHHRVIDPGSLWLNSEDEVPPSLSECCKRSGVKDNVTHNAVDDAIVVAEVIIARLK